MRFSIDLDLDKLKAQELDVLTFVHNHQQEVAEQSITQFAQATHMTPASVTRFCQKLGFSGFPELRFYVKTLMFDEELDEKTAQQVEPTSIAHAQTALINDIEGTSGFLNSSQLTNLCELLVSGRAIYLFTPGGLTDLCVMYLERSLIELAIPNVYLFRSSRATRRMIQELDEGQIFFFISNSGSYTPTLELAREAKIHGMYVVSISSTEHNDLAELSDIRLRYFNKERAILGADYSARTCAFVAIRMLIEHLALFMKERQQ